MRTPNHHLRSPAPGLLGLAFALLAAIMPIGAALSAAPASPVAPDQGVATINRIIEQRWRSEGVAPAPDCGDAAFCRRLYLDLVGRIPLPEEVDAFLASPAPGRREALVDRLLQSDAYARRMRDVFDVVFMGRDGDTGGRRRNRGESEKLRGQWLEFLQRGFAENRPWDRMASDIVLARPAAEADQGAVYFLYRRADRFQEVAEAVSPSIFGIQVGCAQCHDHPLVAEIKQGHYWGLVSFFNRGKNVETPAGPRVAEAAIGGFNNYADLSGKSSPALLTFLGASTIPEERPAEGAKEVDSPELYRPPSGPWASDPPPPRFSRREKFVEQVIRGNPLVARAAVNRFWALLMGRGLVHPVDLMDSAHPPSHPELLDALADDFKRSGFDVRRLVRTLVLSRPYALDSRRQSSAGPELFACGIEKPLTAEAYYRSLLTAATGRTDGEQNDLLSRLVEVFPDVFVEEHNSTLRQSMFLTNSPLLNRLVRAGEGSPAGRLAAMADPTQRVREAYRIAFSRAPSPEEEAACLAYLAARPDRQVKATEQLWWSLLTSAEFRFNH